MSKPPASGPSGQPVMDPEWAAESNLTRILAISAIVHIITAIVVGLRLYARVFVLRKPAIDDLFIVGAYFGGLAELVSFIVGGYHGLGRHQQTLSADDIAGIDHAVYVQTLIAAVVGFALLKVSIAIFLLRLGGNTAWFRRALWATVAFITVYTLFAFFSFTFRCWPISGVWDKTINAKCYSWTFFVGTALLNTACNMFTDIVFATIPIPIIWNLQMSRRTRLGLIGLLSVGWLAAALGIPKAYYQFASSTMVDQTFDQSMNFWGNMQMHMGIIAASVPCLKPLFKKSSTSTSNNNNQYDDIERAQTYGSGRPSKRRRTFLTTNGTLNGNENFELTSRTSVRESVLGNFSTSGQGKKNAVYSVTEERVGSEDNILDDKEDLKGIMRTREVTVQHTEKADQKWPLAQ